MSKLYSSLLIVVLLGFIVSCDRKADNSMKMKNQPGVVDVQAVYDSATDEHLFETTVDSIPTGWTTFRFINASPATHFMVLEHLPEGKTIKDMKKEVLPVFQSAMNLIMEGNQENGMAELGKLPEWIHQLQFTGGPGLTSPGRTTETMVNLTPGNYVMECYIKTPDGTFHSVLGMMRNITVTDTPSNLPEPQNPTLDITVSNEGFDVVGEFTPGSHLVAVHFTEPEPPLLGNDVHIARLQPDQDISSVTNWMDWSRPDGLVSGHDGVASAPAEFVGGTQEMPMGNTAYFRTELRPGRYLMVSERPANKPMFMEFSIPAQQAQLSNN